MNLVALTNCFP